MQIFHQLPRRCQHNHSNCDVHSKGGWERKIIKLFGVPWGYGLDWSFVVGDETAKIEALSFYSSCSTIKTDLYSMTVGAEQWPGFCIATPLHMNSLEQDVNYTDRHYTAWALPRLMNETVVAQSVRAFALHAEGWVFKSQLWHTYIVKTIITTLLLNSRQ